MFHQSISKDIFQKKKRQAQNFLGRKGKEEEIESYSVGVKFVLNLLFATRSLVVENATIIGEGYFAGSGPASFLGGSVQTQLKDRLQLIQLLGM